MTGTAEPNVSEDPRPASIILPEDWRNRAPRVPGSQVLMILDELRPAGEFHGGVNILGPGRAIPRHWHGAAEFQFILLGEGQFLGPDGQRTRIGRGATVYAPAGPAGVHGFENSGDRPLEILFLYPTEAGAAPETSFLEPLTNLLGAE